MVVFPASLYYSRGKIWLCCPLPICLWVKRTRKLNRENGQPCLSLPFLNCISVALSSSVKRSLEQMRFLLEEPDHVVRIFVNNSFFLAGSVNRPQCSDRPARKTGTQPKLGHNGTTVLLNILSLQEN